MFRKSDVESARKWPGLAPSRCPATKGFNERCVICINYANEAAYANELLLALVEISPISTIRQLVWTNCKVVVVAAAAAGVAVVVVAFNWDSLRILLRFFDDWSHFWGFFRILWRFWRDFWWFWRDFLTNLIKFKGFLWFLRILGIFKDS